MEKTIASGGEDSEIRLWEAATGKLKKTLAGHTLWVISVAFSPDGGTLASGGWEGNISLMGCGNRRPQNNIHRAHFLDQ